MNERRLKLLQTRKKLTEKKTEAELLASKEYKQKFLVQVNKLKDSVDQLASSIDDRDWAAPINDLSEQVEKLKTLDTQLDKLDKTLARIPKDYREFPKQLFSEHLKSIKATLSEYISNQQQFIETVNKQLVKDIYAIYKLTDSDTNNEATQFHGYLKEDGKWFILQIKGVTEVTYRYAAGDENYRQAWDDRIKLDYGYFDEAGIRAS